MKTQHISIAVLTITLSASAALAAPTLDEAMVSAKTAHKTLIVEFGATWCGPCKALAHDAATLAGKAALASVVLVSYDIDSEPGATLSAKFGVESLPTLIALAPDGAEIARRSGYGGMSALSAWSKEIPLRSLPLDRLLADRDPRAQLLAGRRLTEAGRRADAAAAYRRAARGPADVAPEAAWALARIAATDARDGFARREAIRIARSWPASDAAEHAALWLAADRNPPTALLDTVLTARVALLDEPDRINNLAYAAIRAKAWKGAEAAAARLRMLAPTSPQYLDTVAEVAHAQGRRDEAVTTERKAISLASLRQVEQLGLDENLGRFLAADGTPSRDVAGYEAASLDDHADAPPHARAVPAWVSAQRAMVDVVRAKCAAVAGDAVSFFGYVIAGDKANLVVPRPGTPAALTACAAEAVRDVELGAGRAVEIAVPMIAPSFDEAVRAATDKAKAECVAEASDIAGVDVVLSVRKGERPTVTAAAGSAALRACLSRTFAETIGTMPAAAIRLVQVEFAR